MNSFNYYLKVVKDNYANFNGRARRSEYWYFVLYNLLISIVLTAIDGALGLETIGVADVYSLGVIVPSIAVAIRRMHDVGKSGWFCLIPIYNLILAATEGEAGSNEYGADPKNPNSDDVIDHLVE